LIRYNQGPLETTTLNESPDNTIFPGPGNFIIDKNINHDKKAPTYMLIPEEE